MLDTPLPDMSGYVCTYEELTEHLANGFLFRFVAPNTLSPMLRAI
jgi:hypothetical protein